MEISTDYQAATDPSTSPYSYSNCFLFCFVFFRRHHLRFDSAEQAQDENILGAADGCGGREELAPERAPRLVGVLHSGYAQGTPPWFQSVTDKQLLLMAILHIIPDRQNYKSSVLQ